MKAATHYYKCTTRPGRGIRARSFAAHLERRFAGAALPCHAMVNADAPRLVAAAGAGARMAADTDTTHETPRVSKVPHVLLVDQDAGSAQAMSALLMPEARVIHAATLAEARRMLSQRLFTLAVIDPSLPDGDAEALLPLLGKTPVLVHARREPTWAQHASAFLPKPWTTPRVMWSAISRLLGVPSNMTAGD